MTLAENVHGHLTIHPGLVALIGARCYPLRLPQNPTLPAVTYQRISSVHNPTHDGDTGLRTVRWQVSCWATTYKAAEAVVAQVVDACNGWADARPGEAAFIENQLDFYLPEVDMYHTPVDVIVQHRD